MSVENLIMLLLSSQHDSHDTWKCNDINLEMVFFLWLLPDVYLKWRSISEQTLEPVWNWFALNGSEQPCQFCMSQSQVSKGVTPKKIKFRVIHIRMLWVSEQWIDNRLRLLSRISKSKYTRIVYCIDKGNFSSPKTGGSCNATGQEQFYWK